MALVVFFLGGICSLSQAAPEAARGETVAAARANSQRRVEMVETLRAGLENAKTTGERRALIEAFRSQQEEMRVPLAEAKGSVARSSLEVIAQMKARASGDPAALERVSGLESRLQAAESLKSKLQSLSEASPEQREAILEEIQTEREKLKPIVERVVVDQTSSAKALPVRDVAGLPPEMRAMLAKNEERRREISALKESLDQATTPEQRAQLVRAWQEKRIAERPVAPPTPSAR